MGTNYYYRTNICDCIGGCGRYDEKHIGKNSAGWEFSFQGYYNFGDEDKPDIRSFEEWKKELQTGGKIFDEYDRETSYEEFIAFVEEMQTGKFNNRPNKNHYDYCKSMQKERYYDMNNDWKDKEGYSFTTHDFS